MELTIYSSMFYIVALLRVKKADNHTHTADTSKFVIEVSRMNFSKRHQILQCSRCCELWNSSLLLGFY